MSEQPYVDADPDEFVDDPESRQQQDRDSLAVRLNALVTPLSARDDVLLRCVWEKKPDHPDAPAWFDPTTAWITVNADYALGDTNPAEVDPLTPAGRMAHPEIVGLCCHEAAHAQCTQWTTEFRTDMDPAVARAATLLEEPRIEGRQIERRPQDRPYLRAQSVMIDLKPLAQQVSRAKASVIALLVLGRVDAGVLDEDDVSEVAEQVEAILGEDLLLLRDCWLDALDLRDGDTEGLAAVAQRWVDIVGPDDDLPSLDGMACTAAGAPSTDQCPGGGSAAGQAEGDEESADQEQSEASSPLADALDHAQQKSAETAQSEVEDAETPVPDRRKDQALAKAKQEASDRKKQQAAQEQSAEVFHGYSETVGGSAISGTRAPTTAERRLATRIGQTLRRARFRDPVRTVTRAKAPPGRMVGRDVMLRDAQRTRGEIVTARPFRHRVVRRVPEPPVTLGVMVDISGSMAWATGIIATCAWAFSHAVHTIQGRSASVAFGDTVLPITHPGAPPRQVTTFQAAGGYEEFCEGFAALDGALNLSTGQGVRVLVVVSDGQFVKHGEMHKSAEAVSRALRNGVIVLWVHLQGGNNRIPQGVTPVPVPVVETVANGRRERTPDVESIPRAMENALEAALRTR